MALADAKAPAVPKAPAVDKVTPMAKTFRIEKAQSIMEEIFQTTPGRAEGLTIEQIHAALALCGHEHVELQVLKVSMGYLIEEGELFNTIDEEHFKL